MHTEIGGKREREEREKTKAGRQSGEREGERGVVSERGMDE